MPNEKIYIVMNNQSGRILAGPTTLEDACDVASALDDQMYYMVVCRLVPVDCANGTIEAEYRENGHWPPKH